MISRSRISALTGCLSSDRATGERAESLWRAGVVEVP